MDRSPLPALKNKSVVEILDQFGETGECEVIDLVPNPRPSFLVIKVLEVLSLLGLCSLMLQKFLRESNFDPPRSHHTLNNMR